MTEDWNKQLKQMLDGQYHIGECPPAPEPGPSLEDVRASTKRQAELRSESRTQHPSAADGKAPAPSTSMAKASPATYRAPASVKFLLFGFAVLVIGYMVLTAWLYGG